MLIRCLVVAGTASAAMSFALAANGALAQSDPEPMMFFVAKGKPDACGPGCSEWIAAEGLFEGPAVEQRFREFLGTLKDRDLPIFFESRGGVIGEARVLGRILRERRMTASVGKTLPEDCHGRSATDASCRRIIQSTPEIKAELRTAGAVCHSACVYALVGASARHVPAAARLGVHASAATAESKAASLRPGGPTAEQLASGRRRYLVEMGVSPRLFDVSARTPSTSLHILSRDEIAQLGIEMRTAYETEWMTFEDRSSKVQVLLKAITQARGPNGKEYRTINVTLYCTGGAPRLIYQRELASNEIAVPTAVRAVTGSTVLVLQPQPLAGATDKRIAIAGRDFVAKAVAAGSIVFTEAYSPTNAGEWSREVKVSTAGLEKALDTSLKECSKI